LHHTFPSAAYLLRDHSELAPVAKTGESHY
jgi:hypothetical protein